MNIPNLSFLILFMVLPTLSFAQIPKGHFLDSDGEIKPFKQEEKEIYHYAVLSELPFENTCPKKNQINCTEEKLSELINDGLKNKPKYKGRAYVYFTVNENAEIKDVNVTSYPKSNSINNLLEKVTKKLTMRHAQYNGRIVKTRLWTYLVFE